MIIRQFFHLLGQSYIQRGDNITHIMGCQPNHHPVVDIGPLRMVIDFIRIKTTKLYKYTHKNASK